MLSDAISWLIIGKCNFQATLPSGFQEDLAGGEALRGDRRQKREKPEYFSSLSLFPDTSLAEAL